MRFASVLRALRTASISPQTASEVVKMLSQERTSPGGEDDLTEWIRDGLMEIYLDHGLSAIQFPTYLDAEILLSVEHAVRYGLGGTPENDFIKVVDDAIQDASLRRPEVYPQFLPLVAGFSNMPDRVPLEDRLSLLLNVAVRATGAGALEIGHLSLIVPADGDLHPIEVRVREGFASVASPLVRLPGTTGLRDRMLHRIAAEVLITLNGYTDTLSL